MNVQINNVETFKTTLEKYNSSIVKLLNEKYGITPDEFFITCVNAVKKTPKLLNCSPQSLFGAILICAEVGLKPNTPDQHCFILPYGETAKFQIGYKGLIEIMYRNERVKSVFAEAVYENDEFDYHYGLNPDLRHKPAETKRGKLTHTYCIVELKDASPVFTVVGKEQLDEIESFSPSSNAKDSPYNSGKDIHNYMQIKASVKKISKLLPKQNSIDLSKAVSYDSKFEGGDHVIAPVPNEKNISLPKVVEGGKKSLNSAFDDQFVAPNPSENMVEQKPKTEQNENKTDSNKTDKSTLNETKEVDKKAVESSQNTKKETINSDQELKLQPKGSDEVKKEPTPPENKKTEPFTNSQPKPTEEKKVVQKDVTNTFDDVDGDIDFKMLSDSQFSDPEMNGKNEPEEKSESKPEPKKETEKPKENKPVNSAPKKEEVKETPKPTQNKKEVETKKSEPEKKQETKKPDEEKDIFDQAEKGQTNKSTLF